MKLTNLIKPFFLMFTLLSGSVFAADQVYTGFFSDKAISGYDSVSFFSEAGPVKGKAEFAFSYKGATWYFASRDNLDKFKADPDAYAPQYGGHCAWAMSRNKTAPGNAPFSTIYKGKLYLNYDQTVLDTWRADKDAFIEKADAHWAAMDKE